jgi:nifR3 family TIM-barrel protein
MKIGNININGIAALAPMAGTADKAFREICVSFGAAYVVSEMVSAKALNFSDKKSRKLMNLSEHEQPCGIQIFGSEPNVMASAAEIALGYNPQIIDINMGCPAPKVTSNGCGSALMKSPKLCFDIVSAVKRVSDIPVTVKIRKGFDENSVNALEIAKICEQAGADAITVHGRTRNQMYSGKVDLDIIKKVKDAVNIPVIGN